MAGLHRPFPSRMKAEPSFVCLCVPRVPAVGVGRFDSLCCRHPRPCRSLILVAEPFGFGEDGRLNITVSKFTLWSKKAIKKYDRCVQLQRRAALLLTPSGDRALIAACPASSAVVAAF